MLYAALAHISESRLVLLPICKSALLGSALTLASQSKLVHRIARSLVLHGEYCTKVE